MSLLIQMLRDADFINNVSKSVLIQSEAQSADMTTSFYKFN